MRHSLRSLVVASMTLLFTLACNSDGPSIGINGSRTTLVMGLSRQYTVNFPGIPDDSVLWSLPDGAGSGVVDSTGRFTAGLLAGSWHIVATAMDDSTTTDTLTVTVVPYATPTPLGVAAYGVSVNAAGTIAAADNSTAVRFLPVAGGTVTATTGDDPVHVAYAPNGATAFATSMGGRVYRNTTTTGAIVDTANFGGPVYNLAIRPTDATVYVTNAAGWIVKLAPTTLAPIDSVKLASASNGLAFGPGGGTLWVSTIDAGVVYRIDAATLAKTDSFVVGVGLQRVAVAPSEDSVYVANESAGEVEVIRPSTRTVTAVALPHNPHGVAISSDGKRLFVTQVSGARVSVLARKSMTLLGVVPVGGTPRNLAAVPGSSDMVVSTEVDLVRIH